MFCVSNATLTHNRYIFPIAHANAIRYASLRQLLLPLSVYTAVTQAESLHCASTRKDRERVIKIYGLNLS